MGQKVNPISLRLGVIRTWDSRWFAKGREYADHLHEDMRLRKFLHEKLKHAGVARIVMERAVKKNLKILIFTAAPGKVIGKKGSGIDSLKLEVQKLIPSDIFLTLNIEEVRKPDIDAQLIAVGIAKKLEERASWRKTLKKAIVAAIRGGVRGIKVQVSGRLDGAEIARTEWYTEKSVPLHTLRADIEFGTAEALTTYGIIGAKVWVYKGDVMTAREVEEAGRVKS